jgi:hypothetical protein
VELIRFGGRQPKLRQAYPARHERVRKVSVVQTRRAAESYERELREALLSGSRKERKESPRFETFVDEYMRVYRPAQRRAARAAVG